MDKGNLESKQWMLNQRKRWIAFSLLSLLFVALSIGLFIGFLVNLISSISLTTAVLTVSISVFSFMFLISKNIKLKLNDLSVFLNQNFPELEESSQLLLYPQDQLNNLQSLQVNKINSVLLNIKSLKKPVLTLRNSILILFLSIFSVILLSKIPFKTHSDKINQAKVAQVSNAKDLILPVITSVNVSIKAPNYTRLSVVQQKQFSLKVVEGANVSWNIKTDIAVKQIQFIFNDKERIGLKPNKEKTEWRTSNTFTKPGFYQVLIDGKKSELYQIEVIKDLPVNIKISQPQQQTTIDFGQPYKIILKALLTDDYGITETYINATTASGKGESVSFKERRIDFEQSINGMQLSLNKTIDLKALKMSPGDELYFYINAKDNHGQVSKSDIYIVSIADTSEIMSMNGMLGGVNLVPEYFRSQRQIIIDTEKLLKDQASINPEEFKNRSNNLGIDQKLLRLRYGKFLGEENEENIGAGPEGEVHTADDGHDHGNKEEKKFGDVSAIMDQYAHNHDNAEDANFFEPEQKAKLKATLTEMWNAELRLRTYKPQEALPFEYKALRLLKDLQQSSRAFVAKTTVKTAPLKLEKRLTGELDKIIEPKNQQKNQSNNQKEIDLKSSITTLEQLKQHKNLAYADKKNLLSGRVYLVNAAAEKPSIYLEPLKLIGEIGDGSGYSINDILKVQKALFSLMDQAVPLPKSNLGSSSSKLEKAYFQNLKAN